MASKSKVNKDDKVFGVDGNWYLHRIFHTMSEHSSDPHKAVAYRFAAMVCKDALAVKAKRVIVAFDGGNVFRYKLFKDYKANRRKEVEDVDLIHNKDGLVSADGPYVYLESVLCYLSELGIPAIQISEYEADDVLCSLAESHHNLVIGGRDKDAFQYMRPGLSFYDSSFKVKGKPSPRTMVYKDIEPSFGVIPELCLDLQTLIGDDVDGIPQLMTKAKSIKGLKRWGSLRLWIENDPELRKILRKRKAQLYLNRKLVALKRDIAVSVPPIDWRKSEPTLPLAYVHFKDFSNPKSKGLFG